MNSLILHTDCKKAFMYLQVNEVDILHSLSICCLLQCAQLPRRNMCIWSSGKMSVVFLVFVQLLPCCFPTPKLKSTVTEETGSANPWQLLMCSLYSRKMKSAPASTKYLGTNLNKKKHVNQETVSGINRSGQCWYFASDYGYSKYYAHISELGFIQKKERQLPITSSKHLQRQIKGQRKYRETRLVKGYVLIDYSKRTKF